MATLDDQITQLKKQAELATAAMYRAQANKEALQRSEQEAMSALLEEFGLDNLRDARARLTELEDQIADKIVEANKILDTNNL